MASEFFKNENAEETVERVRKAAETFWNYLSIHDEPEVSDAIFILGGSTEAPIEKAFELYKNGFAPHIAFISGGGRFGGEAEWGMPEVQKYKERLKMLGVPDEAILSEDDADKQTRNTLAEAQYAKTFFDDRGLQPRQIILVARPVHQRRALATFKKQYPDIRYINCPAHETLDLSDNEQMARLVQEAERLLDYGVKKNDIERQEISSDLLRAAATIRKYLKDQGRYEPRIKPLKELD